MKIKNVNDLYVALYIYAGGNIEKYNPNKDLISNLFDIISISTYEDTFLEIDEDYLQYEESIEDKEETCIHSLFTEVIDNLILSNGIMLEKDRVMKLCVTTEGYFAISFGWTILILDYENKTDYLFDSIMEYYNSEVYNRK